MESWRGAVQRSQSGAASARQSAGLVRLAARAQLAVFTLIRLCGAGTGCLYSYTPRVTAAIKPPMARSGTLHKSILCVQTRALWKKPLC